MSASSEVAIANRGLQKLGENRIESLSEDSPNARAMNTAYEPCRDALMRKYDWNFCIARKSVAADSAETVYEGLNKFQKPNDFIRLLRQQDTSLINVRHDWQIEGNFIITSEAAPLDFRYISRVEDPALFDPLFKELLSAILAHETCFQVTGSNSRKQDIRADMKDILFEARQANAFENDADVELEDDWLLARK